MKPIPSSAGLPPEVARITEAMRENLEQLRGVRGTKIQPLPSTASTADIISKINEIINRLQA